MDRYKFDKIFCKIFNSFNFGIACILDGILFILAFKHTNLINVPAIIMFTASIIFFLSYKMEA